MDQELLDELNEQINAELYSEYLYLSMAAYCEDEDLDGFANWLREQALEEREHAMRIYDYVAERDERIDLQTIEEPKHKWESPQAAFEEAHEHEQHITERIHKLVDLAQDKNDHATYNMLQWFVDEQVEEENTTDEIVSKFRRIDDDGTGLLMLSKQLGQRTTTE